MRSKPARTASNLLIAAGLCLIAFVVASYARTSVEQARLKADWEERPTLPAPALEAASVAGWPAASATDDDPPAFAEGDPVVRLRIPAIGVDAMVLEGISDETLSIAPGHYPGMAFPGEGGHSVFAAHRDSFFKDFGGLKLGDPVSVTRWDGRRLEYGVSRVYIVHKTDRTVIVPRDEEVLTLITCYPFEYVGPAPYRYIVEARPSPPPSDVPPMPSTGP